MEESELQNLSPEELINLSETSIADFRWNRSEIYKIAFQEYKKKNEKEKIKDIKKEILIFDLSTHNTPKRKRFDSMMSGTTDKGEKWSYPDLEKDFTKESFIYYKKRAYVTRNSILKARYGDVVWELDKDVDYARLAIRAYLDCCPIYYANEWDDELADSLDRAITIASTINDQDLIEECSKKHYEFIRQFVEVRRHRYLLEIIKSILEREKKIRDQIDYEYLIQTIEDAIVYYAQNISNSFHLQRSFSRLLVKIWKIRKNRNECQKIKVRIAESYVEEAEWKRENYPKGNMVAAFFYERALQEYLNLGEFPEKIEELKVKIQEANEGALKTEFKTISVGTKVPREKIDEYLQMYKGQEAMKVFQVMCLDGNLTPSYEESKKEAIEQAKRFVAQHIFPIQIMKGNIVVKHISEEDEKLKYSTIRNFQMGYQIGGWLLDEIFAILEKEHPDYAESLIEYLSSSEIMDPKRIEIIKYGIRAFEKKEYVASIHILVFQIEGILRDLLGKLGLPTFSYRSNEMRERMLSDILTTLNQVEGVDKDFLKFIEIYLCDIRGDNYRNEIAHGLVPAEEFTRENTLLLLLTLIKLASYRIIEKGKTGEP